MNTKIEYRSPADEFLTLMERENLTDEQWQRATDIEQTASRIIYHALHLASDRLLDPLSEVERKGKDAFTRAGLEEHITIYGGYLEWKRAVAQSRRLEVATTRLSRYLQERWEATEMYQCMKAKQAKEATS